MWFEVKMDHLFKGWWINTLIRFPETDFGSGPRVNQSTGRSRADPTKLPPLDTTYVLVTLQDFSNCKQWWKDLAGTFNFWHLQVCNLKYFYFYVIFVFLRYDMKYWSRDSPYTSAPTLQYNLHSSFCWWYFDIKVNMEAIQYSWACSSCGFCL